MTNPIIEYVSERFQEAGVPIIFYGAEIDNLYTKPTKMDDHAYMLLNEGILNEVITANIDLREFCEWMTMRVFSEVMYWDQPQEVIDSEFEKLIDEDQRNSASAIPALKHYLPRSQDGTRNPNTS